MCLLDVLPILAQCFFNSGVSFNGVRGKIFTHVEILIRIRLSWRGWTFILRDHGVFYMGGLVIFDGGKKRGIRVSHGCAY